MHRLQPPTAEDLPMDFLVRFTLYGKPSREATW